MSKEEMLDNLSKKSGVSKYMLCRYISMVGTDPVDIEDYARNATCAVARKIDGFNVYYTAIMMNKKNKEIETLKAKAAGILALEDAGVDTKDYVLITNDSVKALAIQMLTEVKEEVSPGLQFDPDVQQWFEDIISKKIALLEGIAYDS